MINFKSKNTIAVIFMMVLLIAIVIAVVTPGWRKTKMEIPRKNEAEKIHVKTSPVGDEIPDIKPAKPYSGTVKLSKIKTNPVDGAEMILIPAGPLLIGAKTTDPDSKPNETPQRQIYQGAYYIYKYEVTNGMFAKFVKETGYKPAGNWSRFNTPQRKDHPAVNVTYKDAAAYCRWAKVTLPTEAQWEKAARGENGRKYPWGDEWDPNNCNNASTDKEEYIQKMYPMNNNRGTTPAGVIPGDKSQYGVMDMAGNINEWCIDWYDADYYQRLKDGAVNPTGPEKGVEKVIKGGAWSLPPNRCRTSARWSGDLESRLDDYGFRCVKGKQ